MNKVKDCREEDAISLFCNNSTDKGILNAISRCDISRFADLASIVQKYCAMGSAWKTETKFWDNLAPYMHPVRGKRVHYHRTPEFITKKKKPSTWHRTVLEGWLNGPCKFIVQWIPYQHTALEHVGYSGRWPKAARIFSSQMPQSTIPGITIRY